MSDTELEPLGPWTEAEYLALDETNSRIELIDGGLWVSPPPSGQRQEILWLLIRALRPAARAAGLTIGGAVTVRLATDRLVIPDVAVVRGGWRGDFTEASRVVLAGEIASPGGAVVHRALKMRAYAAAGIEWHLLVEPDTHDYRSIRLRLHRLEAGRYVEHAVAKDGETLTSASPFPIKIRTADLLDF